MEVSGCVHKKVGWFLSLGVLVGVSLWWKQQQKLLQSSSELYKLVELVE